MDISLDLLYGQGQTSGGRKRRGLGPRNDVLTSCKAVTPAWWLVENCSNFPTVNILDFSEATSKPAEEITNAYWSVHKSAGKTFADRFASCEISFKRMYGKKLPPSPPLGSNNTEMRGSHKLRWFLASIILSHNIRWRCSTFHKVNQGLYLT